MLLGPAIAFFIWTLVAITVWIVLIRMIYKVYKKLMK